MEIELSWPSWLQKVVFLHFVTLLILSANPKTLVLSVLPTNIGQIQNYSSIPSLEVEALANLSNLSEESPESTISSYLQNQNPVSQFLENSSYLQNQNPVSQFLENPHWESYEEVSSGLTDKALNHEDSDFSASTDEWLRISVLNMILTRDEDVSEDNSIVYNETFWLSLECDEFYKLDPPPNFIEFIPPPPIPPFLREHEITFREDKIEQEDKETISEDGEPLTEIIFDNQFCSLCSWANEAVNFTAAVVNVPKKDSKTGVSRVMVGVLIGVALLSAVAGAAIMGIFLKCRKKESASSDRDVTFAGFCPLVVRSRWLNSSSKKNVSQNPPTGSESCNVDGGHRVMNEQQMMSVNFGITRSTSTSPLQTTSPDSENSGHSEDHYISAETSSSVVYAELTSNNQNHHYSEIEDIYHLPNLVNNSQDNFMDETYENFGYILPEISSARVTGGAPLYSPSAYYSDISMNGIYLVNNTNSDDMCRKKRKRNSKGNSSKPESFSDSCSACAQMNQYHNYSTECVHNFSPAYDSINQCQEVPLHNRQNLETTFPLHKHTEGVYRVNLNAIPGAPSFSSIPTFCNNNDDPLWHVYELQTLRCSNPEARRSLPPLPRSRVPNPYRKQLRSCHPHHISSVPSEYI